MRVFFISKIFSGILDLLFENIFQFNTYFAYFSIVKTMIGQSYDPKNDYDVVRFCYKVDIIV